MAQCARLSGPRIEAAACRCRCVTPKSIRHLRITPARPAHRHLAVLFGVDGDDVRAAPADQLVDAEVLEVAAVRQADVARLVVGAAEQLLEQVERADLRRRLAPRRREQRALGAVARIADPPAEPDIEHGQQERHGRRRVVAHVRAGGGAGDGHRRAQAGTVRIGEAPRRPVAGAAQVPLAGHAAVGQLVAAGQRRKNERLGLPLLPGQLAALGQVERGVDQRIRTDVRAPCRRPARCAAATA